MDAFLAETVERRPALFRAMVEMNRELLPDLPASAPGKPEKVPAALLRDPLVRRALHRSPSSAARSAARTSSGWWDFAEETSRLALLPAQAVHDAALRFSAAVFAEDMARIISRAQVLALREAIGADIVAYALRRGRWQVGSLRQSIASMPFAAGTPLPQRILSLARAILILTAQEWPAPLRKLWFQSLGLDADASTDFAALPQLSREQRRALWFTLKKILLREAAPTWAPCFD